MRFSGTLSSPFASFPNPAYSRSTKWAFVLVFLFVWVINERLRTASDVNYHAGIFAVQATAIEFVKLALSLVYFYWTRRSQAGWLHSPGTNRYSSVPDEEEQALNDLNNSLEEGFVDVPRREENAQAQALRALDTLPTALSVILAFLAGLLFTYLRHTSSLLEMLTDPFTFYLGYPVSVLFTFLTSFFILSRTFDGLQWQSALLQFCGLLAVQASLIPTPIAEYSYPFLMGFALAGSCSLLTMDFIYTHSHNISLELIHVTLFASSGLISAVAFGSQHPVQSTLETHVATFTIWDGVYVLTQTILDLMSLTAIFYFEAATAATLVSFGAAIHLLSVSLNPATHTFALAAGSTIAIVASVTHVAQAKRSDEKRGQHFLLNILGALFVIISAVYVAVGSYQVYPTVSTYASRPTTVTDIVAASKITCPRKPLQSLSFFPHERQYHAFDNILLIVFFSHARYDANLDYYKEVYSEFFPNIVFVGPGSREDAGFSHSYDVLVDSYESDEDLSDPSFYKMAGRMAHHMLYTAMREYDCYDGYLWAPFDTLLNIPRLQQFDQNYFWYHSPFGQYVPNVALNDTANYNASMHPPPLNISPDPALNLTEGWRGWGPDWWWGEPHVGVEVCMRAFRKVPEEMREQLAQKTNGTRLLGGSADTLYIPGKHRETFLDILGLFLETDCFLEIATPTAVHLVVPPEEPILYVDHWWIWQVPFNATFVRQKWEEGLEVDTFHTFHWGDKGEDGVWKAIPENVPDVRRLLLESAVRQGVELPIYQIEREENSKSPQQ